MAKTIQKTEVWRLGVERLAEVKPWFASKPFEDAFLRGFEEGARAILAWAQNYHSRTAKEVKDTSSEYHRGKRHGTLQLVRSLDDLFIES